MSCRTDSPVSVNIPMRNSSSQNQVADISEDEPYLGSAPTDGSYPRGYPELAAFMKTDPEINIFRRFDYLHLRELLYLQEEITHLEEQLHNVDKAEPLEINNMSRRHDKNEERRKLMVQIRARLLEYDQLLLQYNRIVNLNAPSKRNIRHFRRWFDNMNPVITEESTVYHDENDLCTTYAYVSDYSSLETIFRWLAGRAINIRWLSWIFQATPNQQWDSNQVQYVSDSRIRKAARLTAVIGASTSLLVPIIALYFVHSQSSRLLCIVFFTISFSGLLALFTKAKSSEIFAATAAFSAVMVVFVGTGLGDT